MGRAARPGVPGGRRLDPEAARRELLAGRDRRPPQRRSAHGLRVLGASPQPRPGGPRLPPSAGRATAQLLRRSRRRRAGDQGLRRPAGPGSLDGLRARPADAAAGCPCAGAARALHRPPFLRRGERDRGRDRDRLPPAARPRCRADPDRRELAAALRPGSGAELRLGPGDHRGPRLLDGQRAQQHRPHDAGKRRGRRPCAALVGAARGRRGRPLGRDQRPALRDRVESSGLGPGGPGDRRLRRRQRRAAGLAPAAETSWSRSGAATTSPTPAT